MVADHQGGQHQGRSPLKRGESALVSCLPSSSAFDCVAKVTSEEFMARVLRSLLALIVLAPLVLPVAPAAAQTWPQRPVKFLLPLGAGAGVDIGTRLLADRLSPRWGQPVVVESRAVTPSSRSAHS
jgi:hypothetical protein